MDDRELLKAFAGDGSERAFTELTARYVDLVYSAAARQTGDAELARDVTQAVFLILARKAGELRSGTILSGWLYRTARFVALEAVRSEVRRKRREETMAQMNLDNDTAGADEIWKQVAPKLDDAMDRLSEADRAAILLRFFEERSLREVAEAFEIGEEAAKKRVSRALERLRQILGREGITSSSSLLSAALSAHAIQTAPALMAGVAAACHGAAMSANLRNAVAQLQARNQSGRGNGGALRLQSAPPQYREAAEALRELQFQQFLAAGRKAITLQPLKEGEQAEYIKEINFMKNLGLALRIYASNHSDQFPQQIEQLFETDLLTEPMKEQLKSGRYEYLVFKDAESKPELPVVWWRAPDERGIRLLAASDGSSHLIREPSDVKAPGYLAVEGFE